MATSSFTPTNTIQAQGYTLGDIYNLIYNSTSTTQTLGGHSLSTSSSPENSMYSLTSLYNDLVGLMQAGDIIQGVTYLGTTGTYVSSTPGLAYNFDGTNMISTDVVSLINDSFSISFWINFTNLTAGGIVGDYNTPQNPGKNLTIDYYGALRFIIGQSFGGNGTSLSDPNPCVAGTWYNYVAVFNSAGNSAYLYRDGLEVASSTGDSGLSYNTMGLNIGYREGSSYFRGKIDEFLIFNQPLSPADALNLYNNNGSNGVNPDVLGYHFDDRNVLVVDDFSENNYTGTPSSSNDYYVKGIVPLP